MSVLDIEIEPREVTVGLGIYSPELDPCKVTEALNIAPTRSSRNGELICTPPSKKLRKAKTGFWLLLSRGQVIEQCFETHFDWLLTQLSGKETALKQLKDLNYVAEVRCGWHAASFNTVPHLSVGQMKRLVKLDLSIVFDVYFSNTETVCKSGSERFFD